MKAQDISLEWSRLEATQTPPTFVKEIKEIEFSELRELVVSGSNQKLLEIIHAMYSGTAYIIRRAANTKLKDLIIRLARDYESAHPSDFYKMLDGSPNFHRVIDRDIAKKYSLYAIKHSYYFYNWNAKASDEKVFKKLVYSHWRYVKLLAGNPMRKFEYNIPSDGQIDRLQIVNYPHGGGELRDHEDPRKNQRIVSGLIMSKRGIDFDTGGFYFKDQENKNLNIEHMLEVGDSVMFYGSIIHGVEPVDPHKELSWDSPHGRWFVGMFVNDSDHVKDRMTAQDLSQSTDFKSNSNVATV